MEPRCTRLLIPAPKLGQIDVADSLHRFDEVVGGDRFAIVMLEKVAAAFEEPFDAYQQAEHTDHLSAFDIDREGVKVVDFNKRLGPDRVSHGPCVFPELLRTNKIGVLDPLDAG